MGRTSQVFLKLIVGTFTGAFVTSGVGASIGFAIWATGIGFAYHWLDWPLGGAVFGLLVGGIAGAIMGAVRGATVGSAHGSARTILKSGGLAFAMMIGAVFGSYLFLNKGPMECVIFATLGAVGGALGGSIACRTSL